MYENQVIYWLPDGGIASDGWDNSLSLSLVWASLEELVGLWLPGGGVLPL